MMAFVISRSRKSSALGLAAVLTLLLLACTPTATPEPATVYLAADGSGDYASLEAAVEAVPPGSTIELEAGSYRLAEPLDIDKSLRLVGGGLDETFVISEAAGHVIRVTGSGPFSATEITFLHEGEVAADVVAVDGVQFAFARCRFTGASHAEGEEERAGLRILGESIGVVQDSEASANVSIGIWIDGQAQAQIEQNRITDNTLIGLLYTGSARGTASQNDILGNEAAGIQVKGQAQPALEGNDCSNNGSGILYLDASAGTARQNKCWTNTFVGISVGNEARPVLEGNACSENAYGIVYGGSEGGVARGNKVSGNTVGLLIGEDAKPELEGNEIHDNEEEDVRDLRP